MDSPGRSDRREGRENRSAIDRSAIGRSVEGGVGDESTNEATTDTRPEREELVFGHRIDWSVTGPMVKFEGLAPADARALLDRGFMDPDARCGSSPPMAELVAFIERYSGDAVPEGAGEMSAHGRVVAPDLPDGGVLIEGVKYLGPTSDGFVRDFAARFYEAESFMLEKDMHGRCRFA
jgi:hypothetical protein